MLNTTTVKEYKWERSESCSHSYLTKSIKEILTYSGIPKTAKILDAGCGTGHIMYELYKDGYRNIWGFDTSESGIRIAKNIFKEIQDRYEIHNAYVKKLPNLFPQNEFDLILSSEVLEHMYSPQRYLENINTWLKKGGYLILSVPFHNYLKNLGIVLLNKFDKHFDPLWEEGHIKFFSKATLRSIIEKNGFKIIKFKGSGGFFYLWKAIVVLTQKQ